MTEKSNNDMESKSSIPGFISQFFWEYDPWDINVERHADLIMGRIMERGNWASMVWLKKTFSKDILLNFLEKKGKKMLSPRELNYWAFVIGVPAVKRKQWLKNLREEPYAWRTRFSR